MDPGLRLRPSFPSLLFCSGNNSSEGLYAKISCSNVSNERRKIRGPEATTDQHFPTVFKCIIRCSYQEETQDISFLSSFLIQEGDIAQCVSESGQFNWHVPSYQSWIELFDDQPGSVSHPSLFKPATQRLVVLALVKSVIVVPPTRAYTSR